MSNWYDDEFIRMTYKVRRWQWCHMQLVNHIFDQVTLCGTKRRSHRHIRCHTYGCMSAILISQNWLCLLYNLYRWVFMIRSSVLGEIQIWNFEEFKEFINKVENQIGKYIKAPWLDQGSENFDEEFLSHLEENKILSHWNLIRISKSYSMTKRERITSCWTWCDP